MTGREYLDKYYDDNTSFADKEDKEWFASLLEDYAANYYYPRSNILYILLASCCFWKKKTKIKNPINKKIY